MTLDDVRNEFIRKYNYKEFIIDKTGEKTIELLGPVITVCNNDSVIFGTLDKSYANKEVDWYISQSLNIYDMPNPPKIWRSVCDNYGYINSNYGWMIFSESNGNQYQHCLRELRRNRDSRRAMMIYQRPSMQWEFNKNGMSDFCCTNTVQALIRNNKLEYIINQRSCDAIYGFKNDLYWHRYVHRLLHDNLKDDYKNLDIGNIIYQFGSLHIYEKHFKFLTKDV